MMQKLNILYRFDGGFEGAKCRICGRCGSFVRFGSEVCVVGGGDGGRRNDAVDVVVAVATRPFL